MEIRDVVDSDWTAIWDSCSRSLPPATPTAGRPTPLKKLHEPGGWASPAVGCSSRSMMVQSWEPPSFSRIIKLLAVMLPTQASWSHRPQPAEVSDVPWPATSSKSATLDGYAAMQFNAVVETNEHAVRLWESLGFTILATVPEAFRHPDRGLVGLHIMHRFLR